MASRRASPAPEDPPRDLFVILRYGGLNLRLGFSERLIRGGDPLVHLGKAIGGAAPFGDQRISFRQQLEAFTLPVLKVAQRRASLRIARA